MKYLLISLLLAGPATAMAQIPPAGVEKDIRQQTPGELTITAAWLEQTILTQPENVELRIKLGFAYTRLHRADDAQRSFETAVRLDPRRAIAHYMLGVIYEKKGLKAQAIASWQTCLEISVDERIRQTAIKHLNTLNPR